jgi:hypothetical protein
MYRLILNFLVISAIMVFFGCSADPSAPEISQSDQVTVPLAKKSLPSLTGIAVSDFTLTPPTFWNGTVDFGVGGLYSITFISLGEPRVYSQASPFNEEFYIYQLGTDWTNPANVYLKGWDNGVVVYANDPPDTTKFLANGKIEEAYGPLAMWQSRSVHIRGYVTWVSLGLPQGAFGTFRIN